MSMPINGPLKKDACEVRFVIPISRRGDPFSTTRLGEDADKGNSYRLGSKLDITLDRCVANRPFRRR